MNDNDIARPKLGAAFAGVTPARSEGLSALLKPKPTEAATMAASVPDAAAVKRTAPLTAPVAAPASAPKRVRAVVDPSRVDNVVAYLQRDVFDAVKLARRDDVAAGRPERSYDEVLVDALKTVSVATLKKHFTPEQPTAGSSLLPGRIRRPRGTGTEQVNFRLDGAQRDELGLLIAEVGAPSRSAFVDAALRLSLLGQA